jgi:hypothetical protein
MIKTPPVSRAGFSHVVLVQSACIGFLCIFAGGSAAAKCRFPTVRETR